MNQECFTFMLLSWNVRGLGLKEKRDAIMDTIAISHHHIVCIKESKLRAIDSAMCKSFLPSYLSDLSFSPFEGSRGGLITVWTPDIVTADSITHNDHCLMTSFTSATFSYTFSITNI